MDIQQPNHTESYGYNSTQSALKLPEYGRMVQHMVDYALTIENKDERQRYAEAIATIMLGINPKMKEVPGFKHKVWDHLAYMSDYKLDIDYPFEINEKLSQRVPPNKLPYPKGEIRFRHYGRLLERALSQLAEMEEGPSRDSLIRLIANRMKRNLADWKGDGIQDAKVAHDIALYTDGKVEPDFERDGQELMNIGENRFRTRKNKGLF